MASSGVAADDFVAAVSRMFTIGLDLGYADTNPAMRIARIADSESYIPWPKAAREKFESSNPPPHLMTGYMIGLWTGMRLIDVLRLARTRHDGTGFDVRYRKTRKANPGDAWIPAFSKLRTYIAESAWQHLLFVTTEGGEKFSPSSYSKLFRAHLKKIGLDDYHFHGLRHTTDTALAEAGATDAEIQAVLVHKTRQMTERLHQMSPAAEAGQERHGEARKGPSLANGNGTRK